jgi:hypothetical protein
LQADFEQQKAELRDRNDQLLGQIDVLRKEISQKD